MARSVFGGAVDYGRVRIRRRSYLPFGMQPNDVAMAPDGNIYFDPAGTLHQEDFSAASVHSQALFIHEMTHVWQHQQGRWVRVRAALNRRYSYPTLQATDDFESFGLEQQADIVRDYFYQTRGHRQNGWAPIAVYRAVIPFVN